MPLEVIMPALGMTQDSGRVVAWRKSPGDPVNEGDVLLEVETDKATVDIEAQGSGYLTDVRVRAGEDVPVGHRIALISETPKSDGTETVPGNPAAGGEHGSDGNRSPDAGQPLKRTPLPQAADMGPRTIGDRPLASPKARRLAVERGLDLREMLDAGLHQPIHADDVLEFSGGNPDAVAHSSIAAMVSDMDFRETLSRFPTDGDGLTIGEFAVVLTAGAARSAGFDGEITIRLERPGKPSIALVDPDLHGPEPVDRRSAPVPDLVLRDLTDTPLTAVNQKAVVTPTFTLASRCGLFSIRLDYRAKALADSSALDLISGFAERLETPLRQLL